MGLALILAVFVIIIMDPQNNFPNNFQDNFQDNFFDLGGPIGPSGPNSNVAPLPVGPGTRTPSEPGHNVAMWQGEHYMGNHESGFISGATTPRTSRTGHEDLEEGLISGESTLFFYL